MHTIEQVASTAQASGHSIEVTENGHKVRIVTPARTFRGYGRAFGKVQPFPSWYVEVDGGYDMVKVEAATVVRAVAQ